MLCGERTNTFETSKKCYRIDGRFEVTRYDFAVEGDVLVLLRSAKSSMDLLYGAFEFVLG